MRTNPDPEHDDALLDAVLRDEDWQALNASFKTQALRTFRTKQRVRRLTRWAGAVAALAVVIAGGLHWFVQSAGTPRQNVLSQSNAPKTDDKPRFLTDRELVASFPKGTCFIAEVDGKKELVFLDPEVERNYVAQSGGRGQ